ncbi:hypothetical protein BMS3Bbin11_01060 [bacterium BMS3Bbin11]|nr:hypothetical protein BMS3Bbin11_01060 [bacterium BMS3Bbin11]
MFRTLVKDNIVDRHIESMFGEGCLDFVRRTNQHFWPLQFFMHVNDISRDILFSSCNTGTLSINWKSCIFKPVFVR